MNLDNPDNYEAVLRRLIDLRLQDQASGRTSAEVERLERVIYEMIHRRPKPLLDDDTYEFVSYDADRA